MSKHRRPSPSSRSSRFARNPSSARRQTLLELELLESRRLLASASFSGGVLTVLGTSANETINVARTAAGAIRVNGAGVNFHGAALKVSQTKSIIVDGRAGNDFIRINDANGPLPKATLKGGAGNDTLVGSAAQDNLFGGIGSDVLLGRGGIDQIFGEDGADLLLWSAGDGSDLLEGGADADSLQIIGSADAEAFSVTANVDRVLLTRDLGSFALNINDVETLGISPAGGADSVTVNDLAGTDVTAMNIDLGLAGVGDIAADNVVVNGTAAADVLQAAAVGSAVQVTGLAVPVNIAQSEAANDRLTVGGLGGNDTLSGAVGLAALIKLTLEGGDGDDTLNGGNGDDTLDGGDGSDTIDGNQGNDAAFMGLGDDTFVWDPGDGSDIVEGQVGSDTLRFNGSAGAEVFAASANGGRLKFTRNLGNVVMDTDDVEIVALNALGGADTLTVNDLSGTDVTTVNVDLGVNAAGDAAADAVIVNGTAAADVIEATAVNGTVQVTGLAAQINVVQSEAANDRLTINGLGGNDTLSGGVGLAALTQLTIDGGDNNDTLNGGNGADTLIGGDGNDTIDGNGGNDVAFMGNGNDTFVWDPGDGSDIVEGQDGADTLRFNGSPGSEIFAASSNGGRLLFTRNVGNIVMDTDNVEVLDLNTLGSIDTVTINDLAATDVTIVNIDLGVNGAGDAAIDAVTVNGTVGVDVMSVSGSGGSVTVVSPSVTIAITNAQPANDTLTINTSAGDDLVSASGLANSSVLLTLNGGADNDILVGSQGNDTINGDAGSDVLFGGPGNDTLNGGADTDTIDGGTGTDTATNGETVTNVP